MSFLPIERQEQPFHFIMVSGDAYVDSPSFGHAVISRYVESKGFRVGIMAQPQNDADFQKLGKPLLGFLVTSGVVDSMVNNYTTWKKVRTTDDYSPGSKGFMRPDRATSVYTKILKRLFPNSFVLIGGIEGSLRRFAHFDYWAGEVMPSILSSSGADLLIYGQGEKPLGEILERVKKGESLSSIKNVRGTAYLSSFDKIHQEAKDAFQGQGDFAILKSFGEVSSNKTAYAKTFKIQSQNCDSLNAKGLIQEQQGKTFVVQNPPAHLLTEKEMDEIYALPYMRSYHPSYEPLGGVKAVEEVKFSITSHRGCFGSCSFCALTYHNGRRIAKRSKESIVEEAKILTTLPDFKGYINDLGGATANFRNSPCEKCETHGVCKDKYCIGTKPCSNLKVDHSEYLDILNEVRKLPRVKKVFIRSGIRFDYLLLDKDKSFLKSLVKNHVSGQLKTAPEHASPGALQKMNKPNHEVYKKFVEQFKKETKEVGLDQYIVPYFISSHPGTTLKDAVDLTLYLKSINYMPKQVQDFYPTPSTRATCMFFTGLDPDTLEKVHIPNMEEKQMQRALLQYGKRENFPLIEKALMEVGRKDLIGKGGIIPKPQEGNARVLKAEDKLSRNKTLAKRNAKGAFDKNTQNDDKPFKTFGAKSRDLKGSRPKNTTKNPKRK